MPPYHTGTTTINTTTAAVPGSSTWYANLNAKYRYLWAYYYATLKSLHLYFAEKALHTSIEQIDHDLLTDRSFILQQQ